MEPEEAPPPRSSRPPGPPRGSVRSAVALCVTVVALAAFAAVAGRAIASRRRAASLAPSLADPGAVLLVPRARGAIALDGDMDDEGWRGPIARSGAFLDAAGAEAHPYSDARLAWGDDHLYLALYAADEDIRARRTEPDAPVWLEDSFHLWFDDGEEELALDLSPLGAVADGRRARAGPGPGPGGRPFDYAWTSGAHVSREIDGTIDDPRDDDEEWVLEVAIPLASLGLRGARGERVAFAAKRCDTTKAGARVCGSFGDPARPRVLVLD